MPIATAYRLPYSVRYHPSPLFDGAVEVHLRLTRDADQAAIAALEPQIVTFENLAWTGALSGDAIAPWESSIGSVERLATTGAHLAWRLETCRLDDTALTILAQLFLLSQDAEPVAEIAVSKGVTGIPLVMLAEDPLTAEPYPPAFPLGNGLPAIDPRASEDVTMFVRFARSLAVEEAAEIETSVTTWAAAAAIGCYGQAPEPLDKCALMPGEVTFFGDEVEFSLNRFRAHAGALSGLSNAMLVFHHSIARILELRIE